MSAPASPAQVPSPSSASASAPVSGSKRRRDHSDDEDESSKMRKVSPVHFSVKELMGAVRHAKLLKILAKLSVVDWSPLRSEFGREQVIEFVRFIALKSFVQDIDADKLSPGSVIDPVWHAAILDTRFYENLCNNALGHALHHRPEGEFEDDKKQRETLMTSMMEQLFKDSDSEENEDDDDVQVIDLNPTSAPVKAKAPCASEKPFSVTIKSLDGKTYVVDSLTPKSTVLDLKKWHQSAAGIPVDQQRLIYCGKQLCDLETLCEHNICAGSLVHAVLRLGGC